MIRTVMLGASTVMLIGSIVAAPCHASPQLVGKAKGAGLPAQSCQYCHTSKVPKKDTFKVDELNERGKWLMAEKDKRKATAVLAEWLKDYPGGKEQK